MKFKVGDRAGVLRVPGVRLKTPNLTCVITQADAEGCRAAIEQDHDTGRHVYEAGTEWSFYWWDLVPIEGFHVDVGTFPFLNPGAGRV